MTYHFRNDRFTSPELYEESNMAYEALIAVRDTIAQEAYKAWARQEDCDTILTKRCKEFNIDPYLVNHKLLELIRANTIICKPTTN